MFLHQQKVFPAAGIKSFLGQMSEQQLHYVHSKKDLLTNEEERNKLLQQFYPGGSYKREGQHRCLTNSEQLHHDRGSHTHVDPQPPHGPRLGSIQGIGRSLQGGQNVDVKFRKFPLTTNSLKYRPMKPGTNSVGKYATDFVSKYPFCEYLSPQEIHQSYNSKQTTSLERQYKLFKYTDEGEFQLIDKAVLESQRGVITDVIKQATINLVKGKGLMRVSLPIRLFEPICSYEVISRFTGYMDKMHDAVAAKQGIERLKHLMAWMAGGFIQALAVKKPFNNIIGETMNAEYPDGTKIYAEHINHDPPIEAIMLVNEDLKFRLHGNLETTVALGANEATIGLKSIITIEIGADRIYFQLAPVVNRGLLFGTLRVCSTDAFYFYYPGSELKGLVGVGDKTFQDALFGGIYWSAPDIPLDVQTFKKDLFHSLKEKHLIKEKQVSVLSGRLFQSILFDQKIYWHKEMRAYSIHISERVLPSDWLFRDDILWLWRGNPDLAMKWKVQLEDLNREWRKTREAYRKKNKQLFK